MPCPLVVVVKVGEEWAVLLDGTDLVRAFPSWREAIDGARVVAKGVDSDFVVVGDAGTVIRASQLLTKQRGAKDPQRN